ncbi:hypothetical protein OH76DRAFT_1487106 [Lentinus brumalis]|uniref:SWIM-type domain-containing protein n=1 Tax=Lentinus brumalis TaxID=2498619 RepID=A0A371CVS4_9APHY|nr:hypothetical protein OH76DRAFT_1487106 [Polyporus brumalis]
MSKVCSACHAEKPLNAFSIRKKDSDGGRKGEHTAKCTECMQKENARNQRKTAEKRKLQAEGDGKDVEDHAHENTLDTISFPVFLATLTAAKDGPMNIKARVHAPEAGSLDSEEKARACCIAEILETHLLWHWTFERKKVRRRAGDIEFAFSCAQSDSREHKAKVPKGDKARTTRRMDRFACCGWIYVMVKKDSHDVIIKVKHDSHHVAYLDLELPDRWKDYIKRQASTQTPGQIWAHIVRKETEGKAVDEVEIPFQAKAVYYYWHIVSHDEWKLDPDPLESARKYLEMNSSEHHVALLDVPAAPGTRVLAFQVTDFVRVWGSRTQELAMDSTWNTNNGNFELFSAVAEANGSGIPLAFLLIATTPEAPSGAKQEVLEGFLRALKDLGVEPEFTLSDKDWSEINAMNTQRLAKTKETPAPYDAEAARKEFSFIDPNFVPLGQRDNSITIPAPPEVPLPRVRLLINGRPTVLTQPIPRLVLRPEDIARALATKQPVAEEPEQEDSGSGVPQTESFDVEGQDGHGIQPASGRRVTVSVQVDGDDVQRDGDQSDEETFWTGGVHNGDDAEDIQEWGSVEDAVEWDRKNKDDLRGQVDEFARDAGNVNQGAPVDSTERGKPPIDKATYLFCPLPHRLTILRLFAKHASQHTLLPERHGLPRSAEEIWRDAVEEMYRHCKANNLCEVWAYLWSSWYRRDRWKLWARSAYPAAIPCKRTTMMVEALWRNLKRLVLHLYNRPPVDLVVYAIVTRTLPPYRITLRSIIGDARPGRAPPLTHMQKALKRSWKRLLSVPIKGSYKTSLATWTCDCGAQKYHAYVLCKHLVQGAGVQSPKWWVKVARYRILPFYTVPINGATAAPPETGSPHAWLSRMPHKSPVPRSYVSSAGPVSGKSTVSASRARTPQPEVPGVPEVPAIAPSSPIDSSPNKPPPTGADGLMRSRAGGDAGFELDDADIVRLTEMVRKLRAGADILEQQIGQADRRFLANAERAIKPTISWVTNIEQELTRRTMTTTNATVRGKPALRDIIGYKFR